MFASESCDELPTENRANATVPLTIKYDGSATLCTNNNCIIGCFADDPDHLDLPVAKSVVNNSMSAALCAAECVAYPYFAIQNGSSCFCGYSFGTLGMRPETECNVPCATNVSNASYACGGVQRNTVYHTTATVRMGLSTFPSNLTTEAEFRTLKLCYTTSALANNAAPSDFVQMTDSLTVISEPHFFESHHIRSITHSSPNYKLYSTPEGAGNPFGVAVDDRLFFNTVCDSIPTVNDTQSGFGTGVLPLSNYGVHYLTGALHVQFTLPSGM